MTEKELCELTASNASYHIEPMVCTSNMDKFQETICVFANDLLGSRKKGYLLIGVTDEGNISGLKVDDALMFNHGISDVQHLLKANNNPSAEFNISLVTAFSVIVRESVESGFALFGKDDNKEKSLEYQQFINELYQSFTIFGKVDGKVIMTMFMLNEYQVSVREMMMACGIASRMTFDRTILRPFIESGLIAPLYPNIPRHPKQKYTLTEVELVWLAKLKQI